MTPVKKHCGIKEKSCEIPFSSGIVKGPRPLDLYSGFDDMCVKTDESRRLSHLSRFAGRRARQAKRATSKSGRSRFLTLHAPPPRRRGRPRRRRGQCRAPESHGVPPPRCEALGRCSHVYKRAHTSVYVRPSGFAMGLRRASAPGQTRASAPGKASHRATAEESARAWANRARALHRRAKL